MTFQLSGFVACSFLLQFVIFMTELYACDSVTYILSKESCKGNKLKQRCKAGGQRVARIIDNTTLTEVQSVITDGDEYWTGLSWRENKEYCWIQIEQDCFTNKPDIIESNNHGNQRWYCFVVDKTTTYLQAKRCPTMEFRYICEQETLTSSVATLMESKPVSTKLETTTRTEPKPTTTLGITTTIARRTATTALLTPTTTAAAATTTANTAGLFTPTLSSMLIIANTVLTSRSPVSMQIETTARTAPNSIATSTTEAAARTTVSSAGLFTPTLSSMRVADTVLTSRTPQTTARAHIRETSTVTLTSSIKDASTKNMSVQDKLTAEDTLRLYVLKMRALNFTKKDSLQNSVNITSIFLKDLKNEKPEKNNINVLLATQELESFAINYGKIHYKANESNVISRELFVMKIQKVSAHNKGTITFSVNETESGSAESTASISIPSAIFKGQDAVVVSILYNGIKEWVPDDKHVELDGKRLTNLKLSRIIATTVDPRPSGILQENVTISFSYNQEVKKEDIPHCVFWDFAVKSKLNGSWSGTGCSLLVKTVNKEITCTCNHLTNFAVLMQVGGKEVPPDHKVALNVITYVGCALSLVGELLTIIAYCVLMNLKQEQIQIRLNLVVAIAIAQIIFLAGIDASETKGACVFVAALIHYFYLAGFAWMLFEGVYLYLMVVKVFNTVVRMRLFYTIAWGLSLLIVVMSIVIASSQDGGIHTYIHGDFCWVSFTNNLIWTFVTPVLVVCVINSVILSLVVHEILKMQGDKTSELERMRQGTKACVVLFPLLGMTWVFGVLSVTDAGLAFQYIFTILNSLQGLFIFILHVLRNGDVRAAYSRKMQTWKQAKSVGTSNTSHHNSINMWSKNVANEKEDSRSKPDNATLRSSIGRGSRVAMQQERSMTHVDT